MADLETFRSETRLWLEANCPAEMREPIRAISCLSTLVSAGDSPPPP